MICRVLVSEAAPKKETKKQIFVDFLKGNVGS